MRSPRPTSLTLPVSRVAEYSASPVELVVRVWYAPPPPPRLRLRPRHHLRLLRRRQTIPLAHPKRQPALSSQRALALCPSWSYSVGTVRTVAYRVCCEAGAVVYRTRPQSRERGRSWMLKGGDTASISAVEIVMVSASDLGGGEKDRLVPPVSGGSISRGGKRGIDRFQNPGDLPSQMLLRTQKIMNER